MLFGAGFERDMLNGMVGLWVGYGCGMAMIFFWYSSDILLVFFSFCLGRMWVGCGWFPRDSTIGSAGLWINDIDIDFD